MVSTLFDFVGELLIFKRSNSEVKDATSRIGFDIRLGENFLGHGRSEKIAKLPNLQGNGSRLLDSEGGYLVGNA